MSLLPILNLSSSNDVVEQSGPDNAERQASLSVDISAIRNTENVFLHRLRALRDRAASVLSNARQWFRENVFSCCSSNAANNIAQAPSSLSSDISAVGNTERGFLHSLRALRDRASNVLSNAWQWLRENVFSRCSSNAADNVVQEPSSLSSDISAVRNAERGFLHSLRALRDRARCVLSNAWHWLRENVFCCCSSSAVDDDEGATEDIEGAKGEDVECATEDIGSVKDESATSIGQPDLATLNLPKKLMSPNNTLIVEFFCGRRDTADGVSFSSILGYSDQELDNDSRYIPYILPLPEPSGMAPLADGNTKKLFAHNPSLRSIYLQGVNKMLDHWHLRLSDRGVVEKNHNFDPHKARWLKPGDRNGLHMTRMIQSLGYLGYMRAARSLQRIAVEGARDARVYTPMVARWQSALSNLG